MIKKKRKKVLTTIALTLDTKEQLRHKLANSQDSFDSVVNRLLNGITDVYVEFLAIDNELPQTHTVILQLGNDKNSLYFWDGEKITPVTIEDAQKLIKMPSSRVTVDLQDFDSWLKANADLDEEKHALTSVDVIAASKAMTFLQNYLNSQKADIPCKKTA
jgi:hypothetical protein